MDFTRCMAIIAKHGQLVPLLEFAHQRDMEIHRAAELQLRQLGIPAPGIIWNLQGGQCDEHGSSPSSHRCE